MSRRAIALMILIGCGGGGTTRAPDATDTTVRVDVLDVPANANPNIDLLFMVDNSPSMLDKQTALEASFPNFINTLDALPGGRPNLHLGVITSDLGTSSVDDAPAATVGNCAGTGLAGDLQNPSPSPVTGNYISDLVAAGGARDTNYTGTLAAAFSVIASVGETGCGFEQPIESVQRALDQNATNAEFVRSGASLAIVFLTDEDDCSLEHGTLLGSDPSLGPLLSFRCTRFGVTCDQAGATTDEMNTVGEKGECHDNTSGEYLTTIAQHAQFLQGLKADPRTVMVAGLVGDPSPVSVEMRADDGVYDVALSHSCVYDNATRAITADPAVRIAELASGFQHNVVSTVCSGDLSTGLEAIGAQIGSLVGSPCLVAPIAQPADCVVVDQDLAGNTTTIPPCPGTGDCFTIDSNPAMCAAAPSLALDVTRASPPASDIVTTVRCAP